MFHVEVATPDYYPEKHQSRRYAVTPWQRAGLSPVRKETGLEQTSFSHVPTLLL